MKLHKSCNCTCSAEIIRDSFTPVKIHTLSLPPTVPHVIYQLFSFKFTRIQIIKSLHRTKLSGCWQYHISHYHGYQWMCLLSLGTTWTTETKSVLRLTITETIWISTRFVGRYASIHKCRLRSKSIYINSSLHEINTRYKEKNWM